MKGNGELFQSLNSPGCRAHLCTKSGMASISCETAFKSLAIVEARVGDSDLLLQETCG